ncbi:MAG TPA: hypothetical protein VFQ63_01960 [Patescibacteria group bacterium]|nr:hypothetical protein [Patescibacteria group bacterium]
MAQSENPFAARELFKPRRVAIIATRFFDDGNNLAPTYTIDAKMLSPEDATQPVATALLFIHGASGPSKDPRITYAPFQDELEFQGKGQDKIASVVYNSLGVGSDNQEFYNEQSLINRADNALNALFYTYNTLHPQNIIISAVSMGASDAALALAKLYDIATDPSHPRSSEALQIIPLIKGVVLFGPAAYTRDVQNLPARDQNQTRTKMLRESAAHPEELIAQSHTLMYWKILSRRYPLYVLYGKEDSVIPKQVQDAYRELAMLTDTVPYSPHDGLLGSKYRAYHEKVISWMKSLIA